MSDPTLFDQLGSLSPDDLVAAVATGDTHPSRIFNPAGTSLLLTCVFAGLREHAEALRARWPDLSLHDAATLGDTERVRTLIALPTDALDCLSPDGWTALHLAAHLGHTEIVAALLEAGAQTTIQSRAFEQNLPLHAACAGRAEDAVALLAERTPEIDVRVAEGFTALMEAAYQGLPNAVDTLLRLGADARLRNDAGHDAADLAREAGHAALAEHLGSAAKARAS